MNLVIGIMIVFFIYHMTHKLAVMIFPNLVDNVTGCNGNCNQGRSKCHCKS